MVLSKFKIQQKLDQLEEFVRKVYEFRNELEDKFHDFTKEELGAERATEKACQCGLDIGSMLIANLGLRTPPMYRYIGLILAEAGIVSKEMGDKMAEIARFRNYLVHEYASLKPEEIYRIVHHDIDDLVEFARQIAEFVEKNSPETT